MARLSACFVLCLLVVGIAADQELHQTRDKDFLLKQEFVYQLFWNSEDLSKHHAQILNKAKSFKVEDLRELSVDQDVAEKYIERFHKGLLPRDRSATAFDSEHLAEIELLFDLLYSAKDFETFALIAAWSKDQANQSIWFFSVMVAVIQRQDTRHMRIPNIYEIAPQFFFNSPVVSQAQLIKQSKDCKNRQAVNVINAEYSKTVSRLSAQDDESQLTYFTEDVGLGTYYTYAALDLAFFMNSAKYNLPSYRRGERYFYDNKQFLARYHLERLSHGLDNVEDFSWDKSVQPGYYPKMNDYNGIPFPLRPFSALLYGIKDAQLAKKYEERLLAAADEGKLLLENGEISKSDDNEEEFFSDLMNAVQGNADSVNADYYGSFDLAARRALGFSPATRTSFNFIISAMENYKTAIRDPAFFRLLKKITNIGQTYKSHQSTYTEQELEFPGVSVEVNVDKIETFFDKFDSVLGYQQCQAGKVPTVARQSRLNHKDFSVDIKINAERATPAVVRLFLGPKYNARGEELSLEQSQHGFFQLDQFVVNLKEGENQVSRKDSEFVFQVPDDLSSHEFYNKLEDAIDNNEAFSYYEHPYGYPRRLTIPRGKQDGLTLRLFAIVSPLDESEVRDIDTLVAGQEFRDGRPLGFPFDKAVDAAALEARNLVFNDVVVYHVDA